MADSPSDEKIKVSSVLPEEQESEDPAAEVSFSVDNLLHHFTECLGAEDSNELKLDSYILAFDEIYKFLNLLGTVFGWVASDVASKIEVLRVHRAGPNAEHYAFIRAMVEHEVNANLIRHKSRDSSTGARNLLRLHRALEYISQFLLVLPGLETSDKCCPSSQNAYKKTLAKHHPWVVQKAALMAMHMLPTKEGLIHKFCGESEEEYLKAASTMVKAVDKMNLVYERTQEIYQQHNILDLP